jgi:hypothetical protein
MFHRRSGAVEADLPVWRCWWYEAKARRRALSVKGQRCSLAERLAPLQGLSDGLHERACTGSSQARLMDVDLPAVPVETSGEAGIL